MFKFELGQVVFYMKNSMVHSAPVQSRMIVENHHPDWNATEAQREAFNRFGPTCTRYATVHGQVDEDKAFATKEELLKWL